MINKGADQTAWMRRLVCVIRNTQQTGFLASRPICLIMGNLHEFLQYVVLWEIYIDSCYMLYHGKFTLIAAICCIIGNLHEFLHYVVLWEIYIDSCYMLYHGKLTLIPAICCIMGN